MYHLSHNGTEVAHAVDEQAASDVLLITLQLQSNAVRVDPYALGCCLFEHFAPGCLKLSPHLHGMTAWSCLILPDPCMRKRYSRGSQLDRQSPDDV